MVTGKYQQRFGHEGNLSSPELGLPTDELTAADHLRRVGYATVAVGKWHLGFRPQYHPLARGFDEFFGTLAGSRSYFSLESQDVGRRSILHNHQQVEESELTYLTDDLGRFAADYIHRRSDKPFFMYLAFNAPHTPMEALAADLAASNPNDSPRRQTYEAMTRALDRAVGQVVSALKEEDMFDNTLIVFMNDNGGATNNASDNGPLRGMKGSKWEGGVRVPFFLHWPNAMEPAVFTHPVSALDLLPTALAATGSDIPGGLDGVNLLPFIQGTVTGAPHDALFWRRYVAAAVRRGPWKLIRVEGSPHILVNLEVDPGETTNVASAEPEVVSSLLDKLADWESELVPPLWEEGQRWEQNQIRKHQMEVIGRDMERQIP